MCCKGCRPPISAQVSIEDAECKNDLSMLSLFKKTKVATILGPGSLSQVVLGTVTIARTTVETVEEVTPEERSRK